MSEFILSLASDIIAAVVVFLVPWILWRVFGWRFFVHPGASLKGWFAEDDEFQPTDNPYPEGSMKARAWQDGFNASTENRE